MTRSVWAQVHGLGKMNGPQIVYNSYLMCETHGRAMNAVMYEATWSLRVMTVQLIDGLRNVTMPV